MTFIVEDDDGGTAAEEFRYIVVYDPSAGFVTGGGWIDSPAGAYKANATLAGKATFGFVSKYQKGASLPTGTTAFEFELAGLAFASQVDGLVPCDAALRPLRPAIIWMDRRSRAETETLAAEFGPARLHDVTGMIPDPTFTATKLLWLKTHAPEALAAASSVAADACGLGDEPRSPERFGRLREPFLLQAQQAQFVVEQSFEFSTAHLLQPPRQHFQPLRDNVRLPRCRRHLRQNHLIAKPLLLAPKFLVYFSRFVQ